MALDHKWNVKNEFAYMFHFFTPISDSLGSVVREEYIFISVSQVIEFSSGGYKINCNILAKIDAIKTISSKFVKWLFYIAYV